MVLDGAVDPQSSASTDPLIGSVREQAGGFERALERFLARPAPAYRSPARASAGTDPLDRLRRAGGGRRRRADPRPAIGVPGRLSGPGSSVFATSQSALAPRDLADARGSPLADASGGRRDDLPREVVFGPGRDRHRSAEARSTDSFIATTRPGRPPGRDEVAAVPGRRPAGLARPVFEHMWASAQATRTSSSGCGPRGGPGRLPRAPSARVPGCPDRPGDRHHLRPGHPLPLGPVGLARASSATPAC